jgi:hypothetical protein
VGGCPRYVALVLLETEGIDPQDLNSAGLPTAPKAEIPYDSTKGDIPQFRRVHHFRGRRSPRSPGSCPSEAEDFTPLSEAWCVPWHHHRTHRPWIMNKISFGYYFGSSHNSSFEVGINHGVINVSSGTFLQALSRPWNSFQLTKSLSFGQIAQKAHNRG